MSAVALPPSHPASTPPTAGVAARSYGFDGSQLGEAMEDWRKARPARALIQYTVSVKRPGVKVCRGPDAPLGGRFKARNLTYSFVDERLSRISFQSSIDAFNRTTAVLEMAYGKPTQVVHDRITDTRLRSRAHVTMRWRNGRSTILLSDPVPNSTKLSVSFTVDAAGQRLGDFSRL